MEELHKPVLLKEVIAGLRPAAGESYLDLTAGYMGHAREVLAVTRNYKDAVLIDRDPRAIEYIKGFLGSSTVAEAESDCSGTTQVIQADFYSAALQLTECGKTFDMILADFGVSSPQLDNPERGFSMMREGPLDMRMDSSASFSADDIVNKWPMAKITEILIKYGEESPGLAGKHARVIVTGRPWRSTVELAGAIAGGSRGAGAGGSRSSGDYPRSFRGGNWRKHPATQTFQAIRIAVNDELGLIERTLPLIPRLLKPGGRVAMITFHSLEDRLVKQFFKAEASLGEESELLIETKKPVVAEKVELVNNPRARSAKLRIACRR